MGFLDEFPKTFVFYFVFTWFWYTPHPFGSRQWVVGAGFFFGTCTPGERGLWGVGNGIKKIRGLVCCGREFHVGWSFVFFCFFIDLPADG